MNEQIEKLEHGLMICEATGTELVCIEKEDAEKILVLLKEQKSVIEALKSDLDETLAVLGKQAEIVRCKNCKHHLECDYWIENGDDWFCADGKRKEGV